MKHELLKKEIVNRVVAKLYADGERIEISNQKYIYNKYRLKYSQKVVRNVINAFWDIVADALAEGDTVKLNKYLIIEPKYYEPKINRNNLGKTDDETYYIPERYRPRFYAGSKIVQAYEKLNEREFGGKQTATDDTTE